MSDNLATPHRPARLPYPASGRVVKACLLLDDAHKLLWLEHVVLDRGEGAYIGAAHMAARLGKSRDAVERGRRELARLGLLRAGERGRGETGTYYPTLPQGCLPSDRPTVAEVHRLAQRFDDHIRAIRSGGTHAATPEKSGGTRAASPQAESGVRAPQSGGTRYTDFATLRREIPSQSGGGRAATAPSEGGGEGGGRVEGPPPFLPKGGGTQPSLPPQGGVPGEAGLRDEKQRAAQGATPPGPVPVSELLGPVLGPQYARWKASRGRAA